MTDYADWTKNLIADIRANGRPTSGYFEGRPVMVLTTTGAKTGKPGEAVISFSRDGDDYIVVGSKSGEPDDPAWFTNLVMNPVVTVEADGQKFQATATVTKGADRDASGTDTSRSTHSSPNTRRRQAGHPHRPAHAARLTASRSGAGLKTIRPWVA